MTEHRYVLNRNEGTDTLHRQQGDERCNRDREVVDEATAMALSMNGHARLCGYCWPTEEPSE